MKKLLFIGMMFIFGIMTSQDFIPILQEGNKWNALLLNDFNQSWTEERFSLGNIENVNGKNYTRILVGNSPRCLLREDNGIVYRFDEISNAEKILFDMNLEEGDQFDLLNSAYNDSYPLCSNFESLIKEDFLTVQSVEYLNIAGQVRKVITFNESNFLVQLKWIEGVGNNSGFTYLWGFIPDITDGSKLACFRTNGVNYLFNGETTCNILGVNDVLKENFKIYPNPVINTSLLQLPIEAAIDQILIYDIYGRIIKNEPITKAYYKVNAMNFASGLYIYQVFSEGNMIKTDQFIVK